MESEPSQQPASSDAGAPGVGKAVDEGALQKEGTLVRRRVFSSSSRATTHQWEAAVPPPTPENTAMCVSARAEGGQGTMAKIHHEESRVKKEERRGSAMKEAKTSKIRYSHRSVSVNPPSPPPHKTYLKLARFG